MKTSLLFVTCCFLTFTCCRGQSPVKEKILSINPEKIEANDGKIYAGERGILEVPENRAKQNTGLIQISFFRFKTQHPTPLPPIFIFDGGPGDVPSTIQNLKQMAPVLSLFTEHNDVVIIEQRGNGTSMPNLTCPGSFNLPLDVPLTLENSMTQYRNYVKNCSSHWKNNKVDLLGYNVISLADDTEAVRLLLGYSKIMVFGGSFGSHHGLTYLLRYPDKVDRVLLTLPEGMNHTVKYPYEVDNILNKLSTLVGKDQVLSNKIPSLVALVKKTLEQLESTPVKARTLHPVTQEEVEITLGKYDLQLVTALQLGRRGYRSLPSHYLEMRSGDYSWLAQQAIVLRVNQVRNLMAILTDCASGATQERWLTVHNQAADAILGDALNDVNFGACDLLEFQDIGDSLRKEFNSDVPMLIIYGTQDARTPPRNALELKVNFSNAKLLEVKHASHDLFQEAFGLLAPYLRGYLSSEDPSDSQVPDQIEIPLDLTR